MRFVFLGTILFLIKIGFAQFKDNFSDGNFTQNPVWTGDSSKFTVQNGSLNLYAVPQSDTAYLSTASNVSISAEWSFYVGLDFNPSSSNYCKIFLMCNSSNPHKSDKAYFVKIGGSQDEVSLYRLDGKNEVKIIDGNDGQLNLNQVALRVKITRDSAYNWILLTDSTGNHNYTNEGSVLDSTYTNAQYFALSCRYSSTRSDKFHFDDFEASGKSFVDQEKPKIIDDHILSYENWFVQFSEKLDTNSFNASNFIISDQALPKKITYDSIKSSVLISVKNSFIHGKSYSLQVSGVRDRSGNQMINTVLQQVYNDQDSTQFKDIVISEFMSDPSPVIFLPESEYIELHNRSTNIYQLKNWKIADLRDSFLLPEFILEPGEYINLVSISDRDLWLEKEAPTLFLNLPSINNESDLLLLIDPRGKTIDSVNYNHKSFSKDKENGGWSLELVNPDFICTDSSNWRPSLDPMGGSPGAVNSVLQHDWNSQFVQMIKPIQVSDSLIEIVAKGYINPILDFTQLLTTEPVIYLDTAFLNSRQNIEIHYTEGLRKNEAYALFLSEFSDCLSRKNPPSSIRFISPGNLTENSLKINELLFNPKLGGYDFVEIYNGSDQYVDLSKVYLANEQNDTISNIEHLQDTFDLLPPNEYMAFSKHINHLSSQYPTTDITNLRSAHLPSYSNTEGTVYLLDNQKNVLDAFRYHDDMHLAIIQNREGISLERISPESPTNRAGNWTSASSASGYATPGKQNSQYYEGQAASFKLEPDIFSPDNDGYADLLKINYQFEKAGYVGSISIFNKEGRLIKELINQEIFETNGFYAWDGMDQNNQKAPIGYYLIVLEAYHSDGDIKKEMSSVVLANKFQ